ncbi:MAG: molybdopterin molybdotransferase MoeA [Novosphingobium sp.]|nr:molybdopterin molybdotransferase MoeA [Novosphingobium sp.]
MARGGADESVKQPPIPLEEAQARLLALADLQPIEHVDIEGSLGRYLAEPLTARRTQPALDLSAMDGYAVRIDDVTGPWQIIGESAAGHPFIGKIQPGQAVRIATGAVMPECGDAVILQEDIARDNGRIELSGDGPQPQDRHVRREGMDFKVGKQVLPAGGRIGAAQAALAISSGHKHLPVRRSPKVAVIDSGDELASDADCCEPHQIPASNGAMLAAMVRTLSCGAERLGPVGDTMEQLGNVLARAEDADVVVTSGGASVGDHDLIRPALEAWGATINFWRVAIKPGKPLLVATRERSRGRQIVLGLPGNPVSSHVTAYLFLLPLLRSILGAADPLPRQFSTLLGAPLAANGSRRTFVRATWDGSSASPQQVQDSGALAALAASNVLIDRHAGVPEAMVGDEVSVFLLENGGIA